MSDFETFAKLKPMTKDEVATKLTLMIRSGAYPNGCRCLIGQCAYCKGWPDTYRRVIAVLNRMKP